MKKIVKNDLFDYENRYIYQLEDGFKFTLDALLLAEYVKIPNSQAIILDMCCGNAPIPLVLSTYTKCKIFGFELQDDIALLAQKSVSYNNLNDQIKIYNDDIKNINNYFQKKSIDIIVCNPPYFKYQDNVINRNENMAIARHEIKITLEEIFKIAKIFLKDNGVFYLIHRSDRLEEIFINAYNNNMSVRELQLISTKNDNQMNTVLVKCYNNKKSSLIIKPLININGLQTYKNIFNNKRS